jgi:hypothetical protein
VVYLIRNMNKPRYWFHAKSYGWGWALPSAWQGWVALITYLVLIPVAVRFFPPERGMAAFLAAVFGLSAVLIAICWWKGEPPRWRWGEKKPRN